MQAHQSVDESSLLQSDTVAKSDASDPQKEMVCAICAKPWALGHRCKPTPIATYDQCWRLCGFDVRSGQLVSVDPNCQIHARVPDETSGLRVTLERILPLLDHAENRTESECQWAAKAVRRALGRAK
jgi:hypothetical protein